MRSGGRYYVRDGQPVPEAQASEPAPRKQTKRRAKTPDESNPPEPDSGSTETTTEDSNS